MMVTINKWTTPVMMGDSISKTSSAQEKMQGKATIKIITEITIMISMITISTKMAAKIITIMINMLRTLIPRYPKSFPRMTLKISMPKRKKSFKVKKITKKIQS